MNQGPPPWLGINMGTTMLLVVQSSERFVNLPLIYLFSHIEVILTDTLLIMSELTRYSIDTFPDDDDTFTF